MWILNILKKIPIKKKAKIDSLTYKIQLLERYSEDFIKNRTIQEHIDYCNYIKEAYSAKEIRVLACIRNEILKDEDSLPVQKYCIEIYIDDVHTSTIIAVSSNDGGIDSNFARERRNSAFLLMLDISSYVHREISRECLRRNPEIRITKEYEYIDYFKDLPIPQGFNKTTKEINSISEEIDITTTNDEMNNKDNANQSIADDKEEKITIEDVENMSTEEMRKINIFDIFQDEKTQEWNLYTQMCNIGGCYMSYTPFKTFEEALKHGTMKTLKGDTWEYGACSECLNDLNQIEEDREDEYESIQAERKALKGTGEKIIKIISTKCLELRQCYDSQWEIIIKTEKGEEKIELLYRDVSDITPIIQKCVTTGDIRSLDCTGLIWYD